MVYEGNIHSLNHQKILPMNWGILNFNFYVSFLSECGSTSSAAAEEFKQVCFFFLNLLSYRTAADSYNTPVSAQINLVCFCFMYVWTGFGTCLWEKCTCCGVKREKKNKRSMKVLITAWCFAEMRLCVEYCWLTFDKVTR